jgi:hypothetical protein
MKTKQLQFLSKLFVLEMNTIVPGNFFFPQNLTGQEKMKA